jgi:O-antigen ligase
LAQLVKLVLLAFYVAQTTKTRADFGKIVFFLTIGAVFESLLAISQFIRQASLGGFWWWLGERTFNQNTPGIAQVIVNHQLLLRPYATFPHPNALAGYLLVVLILLLGTKPKTKNQKPKTQIQIYKNFCIFGYVFLIFTFLFLIFLSFSRSAWLVGLAILLISLFQKRPALKSFAYLWHLLICLLIYGICGICIYLFIGGDPVSFQKRWELTLAALAMLKSSPLVGVGLGHFIPTLARFPQTHPTLWLQPVHNIYLLLAAETGLIGLGIFLWLMALTYRKLLHLPAGRQVATLLNCYIAKLLITALSSILLTGLADHYWLTLPQNQLLFALILGLCWANQTNNPSRDLQRKK